MMGMLVAYVHREHYGRLLRVAVHDGFGLPSALHVTRLVLTGEAARAPCSGLASKEDMPGCADSLASRAFP